MTATVAISRQSSDLNDDSSDGGFQFAHPLFANATPARTERILPLEASAHTSPVIMMASNPPEASFMTPLAQPTYTRFGRRQPIGTRTKSSDGQGTETPGHTLHTTSRHTASVARWKRTGRIGLGPPKRAERQSMDEEAFEHATSVDDEELDKENKSYGADKHSSPPSETAISEKARGLAKHRSSTSPSYLARSHRSNGFEHATDSHTSSTHQVALRTKREPLSELEAPNLINESGLAQVSTTSQRSNGSTSPTEELNRQSKNSSFTQEFSGSRLQTSHEKTLPPLHLALKPIPEPTIPTQQAVQVIDDIVKENARVDSNQVASVSYSSQAPPPKMSLDGPAPTAARKAKTLGRIVMNGREYTRLDQIGKGGSSKVFRVMAPNGKIFALKRVDFEQADQATISGYKSEIDLLRKMSASSGCDRIIKLYDSEINDAKGRLLMLMEAGEIDLAHMLTKRQSLSPDFNFIRLFWRHMLEAVQAVHEQKIVHSDLKPANFLLVEGSLKLIDFGIAKAIGNDTTNIHRDQQVGTVNYMSPEALSDTGGNGARVMKLGRASDVWSLGCILYQMVYGRTPFSHLTMIQKIQAIPSPTHRIEFPAKTYPPSAANDKIKDESTARVVDGDLLRVMRGCLERDPRQRLTIEQLLEDPFLRPEEKTQRPREGHAAVNLTQITDLLRIAITQTREKTLQRESISNGDIENLAKDFYDRLRWAV